MVRRRQAVGFVASVSRGFRAPHMTDLGTLGLTGSGFEVAAPEVDGPGATVGTTADATAISTGDPVEQLVPESSLNVEGGVRYRSARPARSSPCSSTTSTTTSRSRR